MIKNISIYLGIILFGFLLGSVPFSYLLPKIVLKKDICKLSDDHNPGAANVFKLCGPLMGMLCLIFDMGKGFIPVFGTYKLSMINNILFSFVMIAPVLGHAIGLFRHLKGGKCIATAFGVLVALLPETRIGLVLAGVYILFSTVFKITPNSRRSIAAFSVFGVTSFIILICEGRFSIAFGCVCISIIAIYRHKISDAASSEATSDADLGTEEKTCIF